MLTNEFSKFAMLIVNIRVCFCRLTCSAVDVVATMMMIMLLLAVFMVVTVSAR